VRISAGTAQPIKHETSITGVGRSHTWAPKKEKKHGTDNDGRTQVPFAKSFHAVRIDHFEPVTYALHIHIEKQRRVFGQGEGCM